MSLSASSTITLTPMSIRRASRVEHLLGVAAFVEVGDQHEMGLAGSLDPVGAIGHGLIDVGAAAQLHAEQHLDRIGQFLGQVEDDGVEADELGLHHRERSHHRREDRRVDDGGGHRAGLVDAEHDLVEVDQPPLLVA